MDSQGAVDRELDVILALGELEAAMATFVQVDDARTQAWQRVMEATRGAAKAIRNLA